MKNSSSVVITVFAFMLLSGCAPKVFYKCAWQSTPVVTDGNANEWPVPLMFTNSATKLNYSVSNDSNNLYLCIESDSNTTVSGITQRGLQIWIDTTGKKNHQVGILCPIPKKSEYAATNNQRHRYNNANSGSGQEGTTDTAKQNSLHRRFIENAKQMHVSGFKTVPNGILDNPNTSGITIGVSWDNTNVLLFEVAIPLKSFYQYPLTSSDTLRTIGILFNFTMLPKAENNTNSNGFRPGIGMGFGGVGMMMNGGNGMGSYTPSPEAEAIWTPLHLSIK